MDNIAYEIESSIEAKHWWFVGRRKLFLKMINQLKIKQNAYILDCGTSTGANLRALRDNNFVNVVGIDNNDQAITFCQQKDLFPVQLGDICDIPFEDNKFDLVLATDIIEHVENDEKALQEIYRVLKPQGKLILTVPAFQFLWGPQDDLSQHKRRYRLGMLLKKLNEAGFNILRKHYFNYILFLPIFFVRKMINLFKIKVDSENNINSKIINKILKFLFQIDILTARFICPPFGVSILVVGERKKNDI